MKVGICFALGLVVSFITCADLRKPQEEAQKALDSLATIKLTSLPRGSFDSFQKIIRKVVGKTSDNKDSNGDTLLTAALKKGFNVIARDLIQDGIQLNITDGEGKTPLIIATEKDIDFLVTDLLGKEVDIFITDKDGLTALEYARNNTQDNEKVHAEDIVGLLVKAKKKQPRIEKISIEKKEVTEKKEATQFGYATFTDWFNACQILPSYADIEGNVNNQSYKNSKQKVLQHDEFLRVLTAYKILADQQAKNPSQWLNGALPPKIFRQLVTDGNAATFFEPFVMRRIFDKGSQIIIQGDRHGDIHSVLRFIKEMQTKGYIKAGSFELFDKNVSFIFLGDSVDRGLYSLEVVYTLIRFKLANPDNVFILRGNHEDLVVAFKYGLDSEISRTFTTTKQEQVVINALGNFFNLLPAALYLGCGTEKIMNYMQCCHGGIEIGYNPKELLQSDKSYEYLVKPQRPENIDKLGLDRLSSDKIYLNVLARLKSDANRTNCGLMWADFDVASDTLINYDTKTGRFSFGQKVTDAYLKFISSHKVKVQGFLRAHQHEAPTQYNMMGKILNPITPGLAKLWQETTNANKDELWPDIVCTFNIAPHTNIGALAGYFKSYGIQKNIIKDFYGVLTIQQNFDDWRLSMHQINHSIT